MALATTFGAVVQDLRYGLRQLAKNKGATATITISLALGLGSTTAMFSLMNALLFKALPVPDPQRLFAVTHGAEGEHGPSISYPAFLSLERRSRDVADVFAFGGYQARFREGDADRKISLEMVSGNYFRALGIQAQIGRLLGPVKEAEDGPPPNAAVLSDRFWRQSFQADPRVIGRKILLDGLPFVVIGVTPREFFGVTPGESPDARVSFAANKLFDPKSIMLDCWECNTAELMARLKSGVSPIHAQAELRVAWRGVLRESTAHEMPNRFRSNLLKEELYLDPAGSGVDSWLRSRFAKPLYVLLGMSALMLFAACFNVANLLLARTQARQREIAVRLASGASTMRILQQFLTECCLLALLGVAGGILVYEWCIKGLLYFLAPAGETVILDTRPDARMLLFTLGVAVLTIFLFGLLPSMRAGRTSLHGALAASAPQTSAKSSWARTILTMQLAISFVLLSGACLLARSLYDLRTFDAGFRRDHLLIAAPDAVSSYPSATDRKHFEERLVARVSALPGVRSVSASILVPGERFWMAEYYGEGASRRGEADTRCSLNFVTPGYFRTFGTRLLAGRDFSQRDEQPGAPATAIVSQSFAAHAWGAHSALGKRIYDIDHPEPITVIGVARDSKTLQLRAAAPRNVYRIYPPPGGLNWNFYIAAWTYQDPGKFFRAVRSAMRQEDPRVPVELQTFDSMIDRRLLYERLLAVLALCFAACAALLAAVGAYGIASYAANRRRAEIAIRTALGATRRQLVGLFVGEHLLVSCLGLTGGLLGAWCLTGFLRSWLFGVSAGDPLTLTLSGLLLTAISTLATAVPAGIAIRREAWEALRRE